MSVAADTLVEIKLELEYLRWFQEAANFRLMGIDIQKLINEEFVSTTGKALPKGY